MKIPSKNVFFVLVACIFSISIVFFAKQSSPELKQINLNVDPAANTENTDALDAYLAALPAATSTFKISTSTKLSAEPKTLTNTFVKDFFGKYLNTQSGGAIDQSSKDSLVTSMIDQYSSAAAIPNHFDQTSITTFSSLDQDKLRKYANSFVTIEEKGIQEAQNYLKDSSGSAKNTNLAGARYKRLAGDLSVLEVPNAITQTHLDIVNNYYRLGETLIQVETAVDDPIKLVFVVKQIRESDPERQMLYTDMARFFKNSGIIFSDDEPGHYFLLMANQ